MPRQRYDIRMIVIVLIIAVVIFGLFMSVYHANSDQNDIQRWASENGYAIDEVEKTWFGNGPYWFRRKGGRIYRCRVHGADGLPHTVYMRSGFFKNDYEFYDK